MVPTVEIFEPRLGSWMMGKPMNNARGSSGAVVLEEKIYAIGGVKDNNEILDTVRFPYYISTVILRVYGGVLSATFLNMYRLNVIKRVAVGS